MLGMPTRAWHDFTCDSSTLYNQEPAINKTDNSYYHDSLTIPIELAFTNHFAGN